MRPGADVVVAERYRLERLLGEGGMGEVWAGIDVQSQRSVALKFMKGAALSQPELRRRFLREAKAASFVKHPCVVRIHEIVHFAGAPVMVMDFLVGESMGARLERDRTMPLDQFSRIFLQVVSAVGTAHVLDIVHRDLKPDNIFLLQTQSGEPEVRILDFGIAKFTALDGKAAQTAALTGTGTMLGTPYYMSPEQVFGDKSIDHRADIWSLGVIMFEALTGLRPIAGESLGQLLRSITTGQVRKLSEHAPNTPPELVALSERMLSFDREKRPNDLREVYDIFRNYTDVPAASFAGPASCVPSPQQLADADAFAETMAGEAVMAETGTPVSASTGPPRLEGQAPAKARWPMIAGAAAVAALAIGVGVVRPPSLGFAAKPSALPPPATSPLPLPAATVPPPRIGLPMTVASDVPFPMTSVSVAAPIVSVPSFVPPPGGLPARPGIKPVVVKPNVPAPAPSTPKPPDLGGVAKDVPFAQ